MIKKYIKFFIFACLCFIIADTFVNADTYYMNYEYYQQYYDNSGSSLTSVNTTWNESLQSYVSSNITTVVNSYGAGLSISSPIPLLANHTYSMTIYFDGLSNIALSSKNHISIGNSLSNASNNYVNGNYLTTMNYSSVSNNTILQFAFTTSSNGTFIFIPWTTTSTLSQSYVLTQISIDDLGSGGISQTDIDNSLNNQTNIINNSISSSTNTILESNEEIQNSLSDCTGNKSNLFVGTTWSNHYVAEDGSLGAATTNTLSDYVLVYNTQHVTITTNTNFYNIGYALYDSNKSLISRRDNFQSDKVVVNVPSNVFYIRVWFNLDNSSNTLSSINNYGVSLFTYYCSSKLDDTNEAINDVNDTLKNDDTTNATNQGGGFFNDFTTDTHGLTGIITAPLSLIESITSSTCSPLVIPLPYVDKDLTLPCMGTIYSNYFGSFLSIYQMITFGIVAYWVCVRIFNLVKDFKNPDHDEIEVLDL